MTHQAHSSLSFKFCHEAIHVRASSMPHFQSSSASRVGCDIFTVAVHFCRPPHTAIRLVLLPASGFVASERNCCAHEIRLSALASD